MTRRYLRRKGYAFGFGSAIAGGPTHNHLDKLARNGLRMIAARPSAKPSAPSITNSNARTSSVIGAGA